MINRNTNQLRLTFSLNKIALIVKYKTRVQNRDGESDIIRRVKIRRIVIYNSLTEILATFTWYTTDIFVQQMLIHLLFRGAIAKTIFQNTCSQK